MESEIHFKLPQGEIRGARRRSIYGDDYFSFEGIPYGKPPLGDLRFKAPQPAEPWSGELDCTKCASKPVQKNIMTGQLEGTEDCLYLNVYVRKLKYIQRLPVMVYIYGGGFYMGEATQDLYSPDYFMREDVILVTLNYRLCALGFLSLQDPSLQVPGNAALKDQVLALKWVKQYITHFNGDADNITLFGESAGGASTHYMMCTPQTKGLFHKAIPMSGCILNTWANTPQKDYAYLLAKYHGYDGENIDKNVLEFLRSLDATKLVTHNLLTETDVRNGVLFPFTPTVEPYIGEDCVIPEQPIEMVRKAWTNDIPIMIGGTSFEGLLMYPRLKLFPKGMNLVKTDPERLLPKEVRDAHTPEENKKLSADLIKFHFGDTEPNSEAMFKFMDLYSYKVFWHGFHRTILARLEYAKAPTYLYRFDFDSPDFNHYRKKFCGDDPVRGVAHADDLSYLFYAAHSWKLSTDSAEFKTIQRMISTWTSFAYNSDPNCDEIKPIIWEPLNKSNPHKGLNISENVEFMEIPEKSGLEVWDTLYKKKDLY